jgi:hypothetical protein
MTRGVRIIIERMRHLARERTMIGRRIGCVKGLAAIVLLALCGVPGAAPSAGARSCPVTIPAHKVRPGFSAAGFNYGNSKLRAHLYWPRGTLSAGVLSDGGVMATIDRDGSISAKVGWWVATSERFTVTGRRLDAHARPLRAWIPRFESYGLGFRPVGLRFPTVGCWRVIGQLGRSSLTFVVKVTKIKPTR